MNTSFNSERLHYMDNLRALAMLAGVVFHACLAYSPMLHFFWLTADHQSSKSIDVIAWFSHLFRMPLFFLIAGFFAMMLIEKRGLMSMLSNRAIRVFLPLIIFLPVVLQAFELSINWAGHQIEKQSPALSYVYQLMQSEPGVDQPINLAHLWFLYYLCFFCLALALMYQINLFKYQWHKHVTKPWFLTLVFPLILAPVFYLLPAPHPAPEELKPLLWPFGFYGLFFLVGALLFKHQQIIDQLSKYFYLLLIGGLASYVYFAFRMPAAEGNMVMAISESITAVSMTWVCLIAGKRWLNQPNKSIRYIADSSYWIYIIHLPVLFIIQFVLLDYQWNLWVELSLSVVLTMAIGLLTYALIVRWSPIGWLLNGKR